MNGDGQAWAGAWCTACGSHIPGSHLVAGDVTCPGGGPALSGHTDDVAALVARLQCVEALGDYGAPTNLRKLCGEAASALERLAAPITAEDLRSLLGRWAWHGEDGDALAAFGRATTPTVLDVAQRQESAAIARHFVDTLCAALERLAAELARERNARRGLG